MELGSGSGLLGVVLVKKGAAEAVLTDGDPAALANLRHNLHINDVLERKARPHQDCASSFKDQVLRRCCAMVLQRAGLPAAGSARGGICVEQTLFRLYPAARCHPGL